MLASARAFAASLAALPQVWRLWAGLVLLANVLAPVILPARLGVPVFAALLLVLALGVALTHRLGDSPLIALSRLPWWLLCAWLLMHLPVVPAPTTAGQWLRTLLAMNLTTTCLDLAGMARYGLDRRQRR